MQADSWCPLCGADRAIVAWCPRCANALGIAQPVHEDDFPQGNKQQSAGDPTRFLLGTGTGGLQSPSNKGGHENIPHKNPAKKSVPKIPAEKSAGPKVEPHAIKPSVLRHREKMREYMRRRREAAKQPKVSSGIDPNIVHPGNGPGPFPEEVE